jgi:hypothetical protein
LERTKLTVTPVTAIDAFGYAVAVAGNATAITAHQPNDGNGTAYVFRRDANGSWIQEAMLFASDGALQDAFGSSVAMDGELVVAGANKADAGGPDGGAAYVFRGDGSGNWTQEAKLTPIGHSPGDEFGGAVAVSGSVVLVGSKNGDGNGADSGAAYVFRNDGNGNWTQEARLNPPASGSSQKFGTSVELFDDYAIVGAPDAGTGGEVYLFRNEANSTTWALAAIMGRSQGVSGNSCREPRR